MEVNSVSFNTEESKLIKLCLLDHLINLKLNNANQTRIQLLQQIIDKLPSTPNNLEEPNAE